MKISSLFITLVLCVLSTNGCLFSDSTDSGVNNRTNGKTNNTKGPTNNTIGSTSNGTLGATNNTIASTNNETNNTNNVVPACNNGVVEMGEECDGELDAAAETCGENYIGTKTCSAVCTFDRTFCTPVYQQISAGGVHTCGLRSDGSVRCWGDDRYDQLTPPAGISFTTISAGGWHTCGITEEGALHCWGGENGNGGQSAAPTGTFKSLSAGFEFTCAISGLQRVHCWGEVPEGGPDYSSFEGADYISTGRSHACAMYSESTQCWGDGPGHVAFDRYPQISAGDGYNCFLREDDIVNCWGRLMSTPQGPASGGPLDNIEFSAIDTGRFHACGLRRSDGSSSCWGTNFGSVPSVALREISAGDFHTCGLEENGKAHCWGAPPNMFRLGQIAVPTD